MSEAAAKVMAEALEAEFFKVRDLATKQGIITPERAVAAQIEALRKAGYAVVPIEPTEKMAAAAWCSGADENSTDHYRTMIAAFLEDK